jgi:hypothetical protein
MTPIELQLQVLQKINADTSLTRLASGAHLVTIPNVKMPRGWNQKIVTVLFVAPPGYPAAQPDCFWVEPTGVRLENGITPQGTNDSNPIPEVGPRGTWFSWHLQHWNPNSDSLVTYYNVIMQRFGLLR